MNIQPFFPFWWVTIEAHLSGKIFKTEQEGKWFHKWNWCYQGRSPSSPWASHPLNLKNSGCLGALRLLFRAVCWNRRVLNAKRTKMDNTRTGQRLKSRKIFLNVIISWQLKQLIFLFFSLSRRLIWVFIPSAPFHIFDFWFFFLLHKDCCRVKAATNDYFS